MFAPVPATGPMAIVAVTWAPDVYSFIGAPRRFDVEKSILCAAERAAWVTTEIGNRFAMPDIAVIPPVRCAFSLAASVSATTAATRSATGMSPAGSRTGTGVKALPPALPSLRVLRTKLELRTSMSTPRSRW